MIEVLGKPLSLAMLLLIDLLCSSERNGCLLRNFYELNVAKYTENLKYRVGLFGKVKRKRKNIENRIKAKVGEL